LETRRLRDVPEPILSRISEWREIPRSTYLNVFTVEEYEANGKTNKRWTKIGAAFPHKEGSGFSIALRAFPIDGRLVVLPPDPADGSNK
jgi:hypothetical protein